MNGEKNIKILLPLRYNCSVMGNRNKLIFCFFLQSVEKVLFG